MSKIFYVDYAVKDSEKFKVRNKPLPKYVVADSVAEAVKCAETFEDDNLSLLRCDAYAENGNVAIAKKFKGVKAEKEVEAQ